MHIKSITKYHILYLFILLLACSKPGELLNGENLVVLEGATLIDGTDNKPLPNSVVVIDGEKISCVGNKGDFNYPDNAEIIDLEGKYLLPGFVDMHVHPRVGVGQETLMMLMAFGITTIRIPGVGFQAPDNFGLELKSKVASGSIIGPRIFTGAKIIEGPTKSFPDDIEVKSVEEMRKEVQRQAAMGVDLVKLYWNTPPSFIAVAVEEAKKYDIQVVGHIRNSSWTEAARLGINSLVHSGHNGPIWELMPVEEQDSLRNLSFPRYYDHFIQEVNLDLPVFDRVVEALIENEVTVDPTLVIMQTLTHGDDLGILRQLEPEKAPESILTTWESGWEKANPAAVRSSYTSLKKMFPFSLEMVNRFYKMGVRLAVGTDVGEPWITPGVSYHRELELLVESGIPNNEVLKMATRNGAIGLNQESNFGTIAPNLSADLIVLGKDPLKDIQNSRSIELIIKEGTRYSPEGLMNSITK